MKREIVRIALKAIAIVLGCIMLGSLIMIGLYALPTDDMVRHAAQSKAMFTNEARVDQWAYRLDYTKIDNFTDAVILLTALSSPYDSAVQSAFLNPLLIDDASNFDPIVNLNKLLDGNNRGAEIYNYSRYWHGYLLFFKPLLLFFNIADIKIIMMIFQFILIFGTLILLSKENTLYSFLFLIVVLFINPITTILTFEYASIICISMITMIAVLKFRNYFEAKQCWWVLFLLNGVAVAFFDFLTYPMAAIGLPLITWLLLSDYTFIDSLKRTVAYSVLWLFGYAGMWFGKWIMSAAIVGSDTVGDGLTNIVVRTGVEHIPYCDSLKSVFAIVNNRAIWFLLIVAFATIAIYSVAKKSALIKTNYSKDGLSVVLIILLVGLFPFAWYFVVRNHTVVHPFMEYRQLSVSLWALLSSCARIAVGSKTKSSAQSAKLSSTP